MNKIFIDCGGNKGQSVKRFMKMKLYSPDFIIYSFEPVLEVAKTYKDRKDIIFSGEAIWIYNGMVDIYLNKRIRSGQGSSIYKSKSRNRKEATSLPCIDFSSWIKQNFSLDDYIVLKMDIEGAEYPVLNKMIEDKSIDYIDILFIEFHFQKIGIAKSEHLSLVEKLKSIKTLSVLPEMKFVNKNYSGETKQ